MKTKSSYAPVRALRRPFARCLLVIAALFTGSAAFAGASLNTPWVLLYPANGATNVPLDNVTFKWDLDYNGLYAGTQIIIRTNPSSAAYDIFNSNKNAGPGPTVYPNNTAEYTLNPNSDLLQVPLAPNTTYYWEAVTYIYTDGVGDTTSYDSGFYPFKTALATPLTLLAPSSGRESSDVPLFQWNAVPGAQYYTFYLSDSPYFNAPYTSASVPPVNDTYVVNLSATSWDHYLPFVLTLWKWYYWKVQAHFADGTSEWNPGYWSLLPDRG